MILGIEKAEKVTDDIDIIIKKDSKNVTVCNGNKPVPNSVKPFKLNDEPSEDKFVKNMKNILNQSNKETENIKMNNKPNPSRYRRKEKVYI
jgi:hypothetical protein